MAREVRQRPFDQVSDKKLLLKSLHEVLQIPSLQGSPRGFLYHVNQATASTEDNYSLVQSKILLLTIALVPERALALPQQQFHRKQQHSVGLPPLLELALGQVVVEEVVVVQAQVYV